MGKHETITDGHSLSRRRRGRACRLKRRERIAEDGIGVGGSDDQVEVDGPKAEAPRSEALKSDAPKSRRLSR